MISDHEQEPQSRRNTAHMEEELDEMTALSLGIGATSQHSKYKRGTGSNPKSPIGFSLRFRDQGDDENSDGHTRKKLRLSDEQVMVLEGVYGEHCTLDTSMKQGLAKRLNVKPRQVEVWFQNRRARSKQKHIAADYDYLKRKSERLIKENQKLKMELQELKSISHRGSTQNGLNLVSVCSFCNQIFRDYHGHKKF
ncbi:homeobox-leucine zipper protein HOX11-like isoform X1 [Lolium rigidum]|uniref:homeobox-leucine zipper protein HOX11-like isoform X1 n=1 Tax=Lolium rigidum TaxID=89674 RepID=UPI001F5E2A04|nr:homeobox-leucine zipper protein HOX11-like isoform X1 [Lolium rigidum]